MGRKGDRTKDALADALLSVLIDNSNAAVTVKSVSERAGVDRQTFYYHFSNIESLTSYLSRREGMALMADLPRSASFADDIHALLDEIDRRKRVLRAIANRLGFPLLMRMLRDRAAELINARIDWELSGSDAAVDPRRRDDVARYCSLATAAALEEWIAGEAAVSKEALAGFLISSFEQQLAGLESHPTP